MYTIENIENIIVINKSKFIANIISVDSIDEINKYLDIIKNKYKDATHHCYAYILDNIKRFNDDNEPNGTAGMPILECLEKNNLNHVLCVVTRYFGGIKLGAGGLVRAYTSSVSKAIENTNKLEIIKGYNCDIIFSYPMISEIDKMLEKYEILNKIYDNEVIYNANIDDDILNKIKNATITIKKEIVIKRKL